MPDKCTDNPRDCPLIPRIEVLEEANKQHCDTHREIFDRLRRVERETGEQGVTLENIDDKLDRLINQWDEQRDRFSKIDSIPELSKELEDLKAKPGKRWDSLTDKAIWAVAAAIIAFLLGRVGL